MASGMLFSSLQAYAHRLQPIHFPRSITIPSLAPGMTSNASSGFVGLNPVIRSIISPTTRNCGGQRAVPPPTAASFKNSLLLNLIYSDSTFNLLINGSSIFKGRYRSLSLISLELTFTGRKKIQQMPSQKHFRIVFVSDVFSFRRHFAMTENAGFSCSNANFFLINTGCP